MSVKIAIVGRPNVGKSTLFNRLIGRKLAIVHDQPGVTRDRKEAKGKLQNMALEVIDTAGYEYSKEDSLEKRMWEQTRREALQKLNDKLQTSLTQAEGVPTVTISALKKEGLDKLMSAVFKVYDRWNVRIPTAPLNKWFEDIKDNCPPPLGKNKRRIKLRYITQAKTRPPSFYMFSSNPEGLPDSYLRYLTNSLRETFNLGGIPIRLNVRKTGNPYADKKERRNPLRKMAKPKE